MDRSDVIKLINEIYTTDDYGVQTVSVEKREVFAQVRSVTRNEFFEGGRNGLNPEIMFSMFEGDYNDERTLEWRGKQYGVYRTYLTRNDAIELYCERKGGTNDIKCCHTEEPDVEPESDT